MAENNDDPPESTMETNVVHVDPSAAKRRGVLTVTSGRDAGRTISVPRGELISFGRSTDCTVAFEDASLSRVHARVIWVGTEYVVRDEGSRNGTFLNGQRISGATKLRNGDTIQLGEGTLLRFALMTADEEEAVGRVYEAAIRDGLTGVYNRKHLEERLASELTYATRHGVALSIVILDVDFFKKVNDHYGHLTGDAVLKAVANLVRENVRPEDVLARYGGEEFVVVCRATTNPAAAELAERLRRRVAETPIHFEGNTITVTASFGVAALGDPGVQPERASLFGTADARLYQAKQTGRNRVVSG